MKVIYKYKLDFSEIQDVPMPAGAKILSAQMQKGSLCMWALVDPAKVDESVRIYIAGTGHNINNENMVYIDTFQQLGGEFVFHAFRGIE